MINSDKQKRVFKYLTLYKQRNDGNSPSLREICAVCSIPSTSNAMYILISLERKGMIRLPGGVRNIHIVGGKWIYNGRNQAPQGAEGIHE